MSKCSSAILLACFLMPICSAETPQKNNVHEFISATWNTNGSSASWAAVPALMKGGLDVLAIQEAAGIGGRIFRGQLTSVPPRYGPPPKRIWGGYSPRTGALAAEADGDAGVAEFFWSIGPETYYIYYYDNRNGAVQQTRAQNMAIISRERPTEIIIISNAVPHESASNDAPKEEKEERTVVIRPVVGIRIANSVFFNIHAEPNEHQNEAQLIEVTRNFMAQRREYAGMTWIAMGDYNRPPGKLPQFGAGPDRFINIISSGQITRPASARELDYGVVGGPNPRTPAPQIRAELLQLQPNNPSDNIPVKFAV